MKQNKLNWKHKQDQQLYKNELTVSFEKCLTFKQLQDTKISYDSLIVNAFEVV